MRLYYVQNKKPIPIDKIENWFIEENEAIINFKENTFKNGIITLRFKYDTEEKAIDDMNKMWEWYLK
jgi:hypothetical protein